MKRDEGQMKSPEPQPGPGESRNGPFFGRFESAGMQAGRPMSSKSMSALWIRTGFFRGRRDLAMEPDNPSAGREYCMRTTEERKPRK